MSRFLAAIQAHEREVEQQAEDALHFEQQYAAAQEGLYNRDQEALEVLEGIRPSTGPLQPDAPPEGGDEPARQAAPAAAAEATGAAAAAAQQRRPLLARASLGLGAGRGLNRASAVSTTSMSAASSEETEHVVHIVRPEDGGPLRRFVTRSNSLSKEEFDKLLQHTGMFNVQLAGSTDKRLLRSHLPPSKMDSLTPGKLDSLASGGGTLSPRRQRRRRAAEGHRSIFGLQMWRPDSNKFVAWSVIVLLSDLTYSAFIVPISIGMWTSFYEANWTSICDFGFGGIFLVDMLIALHVGFIATCGTRKLLVMNGRLVARQYLASFAFFVDLCACLAWLMQIALIAASNNIAAFNPDTALIVMEGIRLLRFLRVYRLVMSLLRNGVYATLVMESPYLKWLRSQTLLSLLYMMYMIAVVINFLGCLYNFTAGAENWDNTWVNFYAPFVRRYGDGLSPLTSEEARTINRVWLYFTGVYWALSTVATVGFGDIVPQSEVEVLVVIFVEVCGVLFFGLLISSISELLAHANRNARRVQAFRHKMQSVERWMQQNMLPPKLQRRIKTFYAEVWVRQHEVKEETVLFQELPHALRNEVAWQACKGMFGKVPLLRELDDKTLYLLASKMTPFRFGPGHDLVTEGDPADRFWILVEGEVIALYQYHEAERLEGPAVIGESVLLQEHEEALRTFPCTYRTLSSCTVWMVRCRDFKPMLTSRPGLHDLVKARALQSLSDQMQRFPTMWRGKGLKRFDTGVVHRRPDLARASSDYIPREARTEGDASVYGSAARPAAGAAAGGTAAVLSRLARASAPAAPAAKHYKSVSWGGERLWSSGRGGQSGGGGPDAGRGAGEGGASPAAASRQASLAATADTAGTAGKEGRSGAPSRRGMDWQAAADAALAEIDAAGVGGGQQRQQPGQPFAAAPLEHAGPVAAAAEGGGHAAAGQCGEQVAAGQVWTPLQQEQQAQQAQQRPPQHSLWGARGPSPPGSSKRSGAPPPLPTLVEHVPLGQPGNGMHGGGGGMDSTLPGPEALPASAAVAAAETAAARAAAAAAAAEAAAAAAAIAVGPLPSVTDGSPGATVEEAEAAAGQAAAVTQGEEEEEGLRDVLVVREAPLGGPGAGDGVPSAAASECAPSETGAPSEAGSQPGSDRSRPRMVAAGAAALAAAAFATAGGLASVLPGTRLAVAVRRERLAASRQDAEYEAEMERITAAMAEPDSLTAPAQEHLPMSADATGGGAQGEGAVAGEEGALGLPMQRLTTEQALALLRHASLARREEEAAAEAAAEAISAAAAAMAAGAGTPSVGGGGDGEPADTAAQQAQQQAALLAALLAEVQSLRKQVDRMHWQRPST
ncbi:hypothetical protein ABPG75_009371 [Micractinium tetrahymenae]